MRVTEWAEEQAQTDRAMCALGPRVLLLDLVSGVLKLMLRGC